MGSGGQPHFRGTVTLKGLVFHESGDVLVTNSGLRWSLPGGRLEEREDLSQALRREISEECQLAVDVGPLLTAGL